MWQAGIFRLLKPLKINQRRDQLRCNGVNIFTCNEDSYFPIGAALVFFFCLFVFSEVDAPFFSYSLSSFDETL